MLHGNRAADYPVAEKSQKVPPYSPLQKEVKQTSAIVFGIALYAMCSSTLLIVNKVAMVEMPDPSFLLFCQFLTSSLAVRALKVAKPEMDIELLTWDKAKPFLLATMVFFMCLLSNTAALKSVNVETVIVARSCSPIAVAVLERIFLKRELPSVQGMLALLAIIGGAVIYVLSDQGFRVDGYSWLAVYFVFIVVEMVFIKFIVDTVPMSTWTRVYYNNTLSIPMAMASAIALGDGKALQVVWTPTALSAVLLSCVVGFAISYAGFNLRSLISATSFTVVGVVCKVNTVLINDCMWTMHSNLYGHAGLSVCIISGFAYEKFKRKK